MKKPPKSPSEKGKESRDAADNFKPNTKWIYKQFRRYGDEPAPGNAGLSEQGQRLIPITPRLINLPETRRQEVSGKLSTE